MSSSKTATPASPDAPADLGRPTELGTGRGLVLAAAFLAWMFAGLELSMFVLAGPAAIVDNLSRSGTVPDARVVGSWFTWYQGSVMLGAAAGGWMFGWLGDRVGRTRSLGFSILCYAIATGICSFAGSLWTLLVLRFVVGMGIGGVWPNAVSLVAEAWPNASRPFLAGLLGTAANFGFVLLGAIGYVWLITPDSWRWVPLIGAAPILLALWVLTAVPESSRWLASRHQQATAGPAGGAGSTVAEIFRPPLLHRTVLGILIGAIPLIGTSANGNWLVFWADDAAQRAAKPAASPAAPVESSPITGSTVAGPMVAGDPTVAADPASATTSPARPRSPDPAQARRKATTQMLRSGGGIFGSLLGGSIASLLGRRMTYFLISLFAWALSTWIYAFLHPAHPHFGLFTFLLGFVGVTYFGWLPLYLPELFPTRVRSTGTGVTFNSGRVIAAVVVLGAGFMVDLFQGDVARVGLWTGAIYALGMLIICFAPSTGGKRLED